MTRPPPIPSTEQYRRTLTIKKTRQKIKKAASSTLILLEWQKPLKLTKALAAAGRVFIGGTGCSWSSVDMSSTQVILSFGKNNLSLGMMKCPSAIMYSKSSGSIPYYTSAPNPGMFPSGGSSRLHQPGRELAWPREVLWCTQTKQMRWSLFMFIYSEEQK